MTVAPERIGQRAEPRVDEPWRAVGWETTDHRVVIVGGGFGGLTVARNLDDRGITATVVDQRNFHLFQPLLYQVATGALSPADIASPIRSVVAHRPHVTVLLGRVVDVDPDGRRVELAEGGAIAYDTLVVAAGTENAYYGHDAWTDLAPGLKTIEDAIGIRQRVLAAFERAEREPDPDRRRRLLRFAVVGGGATGVELAGSIGEIANQSFRRRFRRIDPTATRIVLVQSAERILPEFPARLSRKAARDLARVGVEIRTRTRVVDISAEAIQVSSADGTAWIEAPTVLWAAGVRPVGLTARLAERTGAALDRGGRILVGADLSLPGRPEIFVIGDMATPTSRRGDPLPGVAPVAIQAGAHVAAAIRHRLDGRPVPPFRYRDKGTLATIGTGKAVARLGRLSFDGKLAWLAWLFVHILYLVEFENRVLVFIQWAWTFFTRGRSSLLITGGEAAGPGSRP